MSFKNISGNEFKQGMTENPNAVVLDVRSPQEFMSGCIEGAENVNIFNPGFFDTIESLDKTKAYYIYCRSGNRSAQACHIMGQMGFQELYNLDMGLFDWNEKLVYPVMG
ncbi:MAG: rhodanese-like domain-containing protein [Cyclobacteriaceae bacterium]|nr:rhodanese-like domain-containing protein [Cyclobacteriaceae bacterium]